MKRELSDKNAPSGEYLNNGKTDIGASIILTQRSSGDQPPV